MLVILILILMTSVAAVISVQHTTFEVRAAGRERLLMQTRSATEAAMVSTMAWLESMGQTDVLAQEWPKWTSTATPPDLRAFTGGHALIARNDAVRSMQNQQATWVSAQNGGQMRPPVSSPDPGAPIPDLTGSFGPNQPYGMQNYIVDFTDCFKMPSTAVEGSQINQGPGVEQVNIVCTVTVRGRVVVNNDQGAGVSWDLPGLNGEFQDRTGAALDVRTTLVLPTMLVAK